MVKNQEQNYLSLVCVLNPNTHSAEVFFNQLHNFASSYFKNFEFILVNNHAAQNVVNELIAKITNTGLHANLITLPYIVNKEQAMLAGIDAAIGDYVFEFEDTRVDYTLDDLWRAYTSCLKGNDIVLLQPNYKLSVFEKIFYKLINQHSAKNNLIYSSRIHLISRRAINRVNNINKIIHYRKYAYCNCGLDYQFLHYSSTQSFKQKRLNLSNIDYATDLLLIFTNLGKRIAIAFSLFFAFLSFFAVVYTFFAYLRISVVPGWTTLMLLLSTSFSGIFACFSIVIKYLNLLLTNQQQDNSLIASKRRI